MKDNTRGTAAMTSIEMHRTLGELIHDEIRKAIEMAVEEELTAALGAGHYERPEGRQGYRNGSKSRSLSGPTGPLSLTVPRAVMFEANGKSEWTSKLVPRYQRRMPEINNAVLGTYLAGGNTRRIKGALKPLLKGAPLSKSAVSRVIGTLKNSFDEWRKRPLGDMEVAYLYLDAIALRVRSARKVVSQPVLVALAVLADGQKHLLMMELCSSESLAAWKGFVDDLVSRGLSSPCLCIIDGNPGLYRAATESWPGCRVQRCTVHKLRNLERKAPKHALDEVKEDYHRIVYAKSEAEAKKEYSHFEKKWEPLCPGVVKSLREGGDELLTFYSFPESQWQTIRTTNVIERLNGEFRRRVKTQSSFPCEDAAVVLLFSLVASGQIKFHRVDGYRALPGIIRREENRKKEQNKKLAA